MKLNSRSRRRHALKLLGLAGIGFARLSGTAAAAESGSLSRMDAEAEIERGFSLLDKDFWSPELSIWLDRPGNDLRACYEGRLNPPWWSCANAVETLADYMAATGRRDRVPALTALHRRHRDNPDHAPELIAALKARGGWTAQDQARRERRGRPRHFSKTGYRDFNNEYLDDSGWWGLAWLRLHALTKDPAFLETAGAVHRHMAAHRNEDGGVLWNLEQDPPVANAISNGLFLTLSARLFSVTGIPQQLKDARQAREWYLRHQLFDGTGIVDGPGHQGDYWSYNQGMWILGLLALAAAAEEPALVEEAASFAFVVLTQAGFVKDGILVEKLSQTGWDTALFKGVLARALGQLKVRLRLTGVQPRTADLLEGILSASADSLRRNRRGEDGLFGLQWQPAPVAQEWNFNSHLSGLAALLAALPDRP